MEFYVSHTEGGVSHTSFKYSVIIQHLHVVIAVAAALSITAVKILKCSRQYGNTSM